MNNDVQLLVVGNPCPNQRACGRIWHRLGTPVILGGDAWLRFVLERQTGDEEDVVLVELFENETHLTTLNLWALAERDYAGVRLVARAYDREEARVLIEVFDVTADNSLADKLKAMTRELRGVRESLKAVNRAMNGGRKNDA